MQVPARTFSHAVGAFAPALSLRRLLTITSCRCALERPQNLPARLEERIVDRCVHPIRAVRIRTSKNPGSRNWGTSFHLVETPPVKISSRDLTWVELPNFLSLTLQIGCSSGAANLPQSRLPWKAGQEHIHDACRLQRTACVKKRRKPCRNPAESLQIRRHQTCHFREWAASAPAEGPLSKLEFARHCKFPLRAPLQMSAGSGAFGGVCSWSLLQPGYTALSYTQNHSIASQTVQPLSTHHLRKNIPSNLRGIM